MQRRQFLGLVAGAGVAGAAFSALPFAALAAKNPLRRSLDAAAFNAARRFVPTRFGRIALVERGAGQAALFLHGFPLNGFQWRGALERLSAYRRCIAPDFLGLGYTQVREGQGVAPVDQVDMLSALLDALSIDRVDLVANDSGGAVAQLFLARHPQRVRSLLLTNCDTEIDCPPAAMKPVIALAHDGQFVKQWLAPWLADKELARSAGGLGGMTFTHPENLTDASIEMYLGPLVRDPAHTHAYALALETNVLAGVQAAIGRSRVPVRIAWGTGDTIFSPDNAAYLDRIAGNSRGVHYVPGAKLFFPEEFPELIAAEARHLWDLAAHPDAGETT
ncbi:alpha/beta hydrolase [Rhodanobacter glycinis]|uniref:Alpha/beta hydrolase n=1 Tax=Rhodanobacter glycinis TaxID=582702 RepID=A0A502C6J6_9GAMM|nr:alpha/beta hydrolase [Rhodanobacter glycinis]TPG07461.1 alpha/beta hydrolase [Rhodanobacter glycinis]